MLRPELLGQAVAAYRSALEVRTRELLPQDWAATQNNLGLALSAQAARTEGPKGAELLAWPQADFSGSPSIAERTRAAITS
jgi:hypothetical protein